MDDFAPLHRQAERIRASGLLGQSRMLRLFDFLVENSAAGKAPKEATIAVDVFDKTDAFDVSQDASVRVYIHNLRRKLDQFYEGPGASEPFRLSIPKGEYRLTVAAKGDVDARDARSPSVRTHPTWQPLAGLVLVCALVGLLAVIFWPRPQPPRDEWQEVRASPAWMRLLQNDKPIVVVVGDYYIFGDTEQSLDVKRLVREFSINSKADLQQLLMSNPNLATHYEDVNLSYLPTSSAFALASVMPVLTGISKRRVRVLMMSELDPATIKSADIVYVGLLSGLGMLRDIAFSGSRFRVGDSYDELIDTRLNHDYISQASPYEDHDGEQGSYHDYGYFSTFSGVGGNRIVIIAGTQDEGLRQTAESLTDRTTLDELTKQVGARADFEALLEVSAMDRVNLGGKVLIAAPLNTATIWTSD